MIIEKLGQLGGVSRRARDYEARAATVNFVQLSLAFAIIGTLLVACVSAPAGAERAWERKDAAQSAFEMCRYEHPRNSMACSEEKSAYDATLQDYRAAIGQQRQ